MPSRTTTLRDDNPISFPFNDSDVLVRTNPGVLGEVFVRVGPLAIDETKTIGIGCTVDIQEVRLRRVTDREL
ncbi:hypothetical protein D3C73_1373580 [compost metagenome]